MPQPIPAILTILTILQYGGSSVNLRQAPQAMQPAAQQYFIERPENLTVVEGHSVTLKCTIGSLAGKVQWTADGFALGYEQATIKSYCSKCRPKVNKARGEFHLLVENVELGRYNRFECQVSPDINNKHQMIRAAATLDVIVPPDRVELVSTERRVSLHAGGEQHLSCRARGAKPPAKIFWYHGNTRILDQEYSKATQPGSRQGTWDTTNTLKFRATKDDDGATISCIVEHPALPKTSTEMKQEIELTVFYPPGPPQILGDIESAYTQGDMINLTCLTSGGNPPPEVAWYKNNIKLQYKYDRLANDSTISNLALRAEESLLTDRFGCKAWNKHSQMLASPTFKLNVTFSGERVHISGPDTGQIGSTLELSCSTEASNPPSELRWTVDGAQQTTTQDLVAVEQGGWRTTSTIRIRVAVNLPQMKVTCSALNTFFKDAIQDSKTIQILRPPEAPSISGLPTNSLREGDELTLTCNSHHGNPLPTLKWYRQGDYIPTQTFSEVSNSHSVAKLTITVNRRDNDMVYSCEASNQALFPAVSQRTNFTVYFEPDSARLYLSRADPSAPEIVRAQVGERLQLNCAAGNSHPAAKITWFKNGVEVRAEGPISSSQGNYGGVRVTQVFLLNEGQPVTSGDNGANFTCLVENPAIQGRNISRKFNLNVLYPPEFESTPIKYEVVEGESVRMEVLAHGNPRVERYTWFRTQQPNSRLENSNVPEGYNIKGFSMTIQKVRREDGGSYLLQADNEIGEKRKEVLLTVNYRPSVTSISEEVTANQAEGALLSCAVDANPIGADIVEWRAVDHRGRPRQFDFNKVSRDWDGANTFTLQIPRVRKEDRGRFLCVAKNKVGNATAQALLKVKFKPEIRKFPRYSKFAVNQMHQIDLECVAYGYPSVKIFWTKAGDIERAERFTFNNQGKTTQESFDTWKSVLKVDRAEFDTWKSELNIESALNADYTKYECRAENELGDDKFNISLVPPSIPEPPQNLELSKLDHNSVQMKWEPGFNGGFPQYFVTKVKEVKSGRELPFNQSQSHLEEDTQFVLQVVTTEPNIEYAFAVEAVNVQGSSGFTQEKRISLTASENKVKEKASVPRVIIVAVVLGIILVVIVKLMIITCCVKQRRETRRKNERKNERSSSCNSKRSMMIERYPPSKYSNAFGGDMFLSPPSQCGSSSSSQEPDYKYLSRSLSVPGARESDQGYNSYVGSCSVHGTLKRHISSGVDTTFEDDVFDDYNHRTDMKTNGSAGYPILTADRMLKPGGRSRAGSLSSPGPAPPPPRLGVSGLYTDYMERRKYSESGSISPPCIPSPPPPVTTSTLERLRSKASAFPLPPPAFPHSGDSLRAPPPSFPHCNGHINNINMIDVDNKKSAVDVSNELSRRVMELGKERSVEPESSMGHLQLNHLPSLSLPHTNSQQRPRWQQDGRAPNGSSTNFM